MDQIISQYFDFGVMFDSANFEEVLKGFWFTVKLSIISGILSLSWGLILAVLRQTPGRWGAVIRWPTIAYIDIFRGIPALLMIVLVSGSLAALSVTNLVTGEKGPIPTAIGVPDWFGKPAPFWYGVIALDAHLRRLHGRGLPGRDRSGAERPDGGGALARDEPRPGDAQRDRPAGGPQGDPARC